MFRLFLVVAAIVAVLIVACGTGGVREKAGRTAPPSGPAPRATASVVR